MMDKKHLRVKYYISRLAIILALCLIFLCGCESSSDSTGSSSKRPENPAYSEKEASSSKKSSSSSKRDSSSSKKKRDRDERKKKHSSSGKKDSSRSSSSAADDLSNEEKGSSGEADSSGSDNDRAFSREKWSPERSRKELEGVFSEASGFYRKLNRGEDVNILINGDSIGAGSGATNGNSWTDLLKDYIESEYQVGCSMNNISLGGNDSYAGYVMENILNDGIDYDLMIICYGQNDEENGFSPEYEALIRSAEKKYPSCNIISILESSQREYTKKMEAIQEFSEYYDIRTADTIAAFNESKNEYEELTVDILHPNDEGYRVYFNAVKKVIDTETESNTGVENIERLPLNSEASRYDDFRYIPASDFIRINENTLSLSLSEGIRGVIGLHHLRCPGNGEIVIKTDGRECIRKPYSWSNNLRADFIFKLDEKEHASSKEIEISFPTPEMADGFKGLIITG